MAQSQIKAAGENDVAPAGEKTLDFDDDTLRGEKKSLILFTKRFQQIKHHNLDTHPSPPPPALVWLTIRAAW